MSTSENSYDEDDYVPLSTRFNSLIHPRFYTEQVHDLQESVRKQKLERGKINKGQDSDQSEEKSDIVKAVEGTENSFESDVTGKNDRIESTENVANKEEITDNLLKSDVAQEDDKI